MALELKIGSFNPVPVDFNYQELKKEIAEKTLPYKGLIVTEDAIPVAKTDLANLRKLEKAIDDRRKTVKKEYNAPYMEFEAKVKDILSDIQEAEANIDSQVKAFEKKVDDEKYAKIRQFFELTFHDFLKDVDFNTVYNPKWLNKGCKMSDIEEEIAASANRLYADVEVVKGLKSPHESSLLHTLFHRLDLGEALKQHNILVEFDERRKAAEQAKQEQVLTPEEKTDPTPSQESTEQFMVDTPAPLQQIDFRVWVNDEQKAALKSFLVSNGIRYGSVK
ncbi:MAG: DUF1351 domain-containing protein [Bacteroidales bacterium]|nr:DUF1351 domain-containing protein [Bacteroidales bacterium]